MDKMLTRLLLALSVFLALVYAVDEIKTYRTISNLAKDDGRAFLGRRLESLFSRTPILPDRFVFRSDSPKEISMEYDAVRAGFKNFPGVRVVCLDGIVVDAMRK